MDSRWISMVMVLGIKIFIALFFLKAIAFADQNDSRLNTLFDRLKSTDDPTETATISQLVWAIWHDSDNSTVNAFMSEGIEMMSERNYGGALAAFSKVIEVDPKFAEGWNKRATVNYILGEFAASIHDIEQTLALEPRHFGALSGLGLIKIQLGDGRGALKAFEAALKIHPHLTSAQIHVEQLRRHLRGKPI
jgi:tetratricopeptide (TPR) repeat protein